jgi:hypothetical protein
MRPAMKATELEKLVIRSMLVDHDLKAVRSSVNFDAVLVSDRELTWVGFLTEFQRSEELKLFEADVSLRWGKVGARLNASKVETGYLVYVDDGYVISVEGYTYGDEWPDQVEQIELYELKPGMELKTPPG